MNKHSFQNTKIAIIGLGYIGLPTAALLANRGYKVHGVDVIADVVDIINQGKIHIAEPELDTFVRSAVKSGRLTAHTTPDFADIFMIAVPTPLCENNEPDINYVMQAADAIIPFLKPGNLLILESTSPVGTTEKIAEKLHKNGLDSSQIHIAYCPERVLPGQTMRELVENDRIVGGITPEASRKVKAFYDTFVQGEVLTTNARTAEMAKLTENAARDVNIAFANELSIICDDFGINVWELIELANRHPRINILKPGSGVGGHCIAIDPWFIIANAKENAGLMAQARTVNTEKTQWVVRKVLSASRDFQKKNHRKPVMACMGITFKPDIDDVRESPSLLITKQLKNSGENIIIAEPNIKQNDTFDLVDYKKAVEKADIIVFLVAHKEFFALSLPKQKQIIDICGVTKNNTSNI